MTKVPALERYVATTTQGIEPELAADLAELGAANVAREVGRCFFEADIETALSIVHGARVAQKVYRVLAEGEVASLADVHRLARAIDWTAVFPIEKRFAVSGLRVGKHDFTSLDAEREVGDAVIQSFRAALGDRPRVRLNGPEVEVRVLVREDRCAIAVNLSGVSLHKRGWRVVSHHAPLRPTIAAALLRFARWDALGFPRLLDPVCGSATIPIEAGLFARAIPPGRFRGGLYRVPTRRPGSRGRGRGEASSRNARGREEAGLAVEGSEEESWFRATHAPTGHLFHHLHVYPLDAWERAVSRAESRARPRLALDVRGSDINGGLIGVARRNVAEAGVGDAVRLDQADAASLDPTDAPRVLVANPPYGVRLGSAHAVARVNRALADLAARLASRGPLTCAFIAGDPGLERAMGRAPDERRRVLLGELPVHFVRYELA